MLPSGRGAMMRKFLESMQEQKDEEDPVPPERPVGRGRAMLLSQTTEIEEGVKEIAIARPSGRGRSLGLQAPSVAPVRRTMDPSEGPPGPSRGGSVEVARPVGRGRSALFAAFIAQNQQEKASPGKSPPKESRAEFVRKSPSPKMSIPYTSSYEPEPGPVIRKGTHGQMQDVVANYIRLEVTQGKGVFEYTVEFSPAEDNISMRTRMINQHLEALGGVKSYNGVRLFLSIQLNGVTSFKCTHPVSESLVTMTLYCKGPAKEKDCADIYNMLFRRIMAHLGLKNMGRKFFDPSGAINITQHRLEVWPGYVTAVQQYEGGVQLCCDASHRVMRTDSVLKVISILAEANPRNYREEAMKVALGAVVLTRYNNCVYRVDDISWDRTPESTFTNSDGREISFQEYYRVNYQIEIKDKDQPLLISRVKRRKDPSNKENEVRMICLIPELCYITGLTDAMRADWRIMKDLTQKLQLTPSQRYEGLSKFLENINNNKQSQELLKKWGLQVEALPVKLVARVVKQESILYKDGKVDLPPGTSNWVVNNQLLVSKDIQNWAILHIAQDTKVAQDFESNMRKMCSQMGMKVYPGRLVKVSENRNESFLDALRSTIAPQLQLVVIFFPSLRSDRYAAIKKVCCIERPITSQVIQSRTLSRPEKARSIIKKIAMQINCKLGGALWGLAIPFEKLMVCGMDVYHGPAQKQVSVMGFVATSDPQQTTWYSRVGFGGTNQELADNLRVCMGGALKKYLEASGFYPDRIIMFRDGVGDGQLKMTQEFEVPQLLQSFGDLGLSYKPKLTVVVCQKRIMTRIFSVQGNLGCNPRLQNPLPGTVLDHTVTRHDWYDFFLVSQCSNRGTVSPTHYVVVHDDGDIKPDHVQRLTYKMTHLYYNWTGTISIPAPAQYAHRLAQLVGQHLHKDPSSSLSDKLYFL
ncbi:Piwi-like protein Ago3 [Gryllus bimaculatus]|nr:Piwi-like protein Ago3 [Gryllus bimaculatus]